MEVTSYPAAWMAFSWLSKKKRIEVSTVAKCATRRGACASPPELPDRLRERRSAAIAIGVVKKATLTGSEPERDGLDRLAHAPDRQHGSLALRCPAERCHLRCQPSRLHPGATYTSMPSPVLRRTTIHACVIRLAMPRGASVETMLSSALP
jgi:hypothetical protein